MGIKSVALAASTLVFSTSTSALLLERLGGLAYYDDVADLTWLADANYAQTSGYDSDGLMNWVDANNWAAGLDVAGVTGWRLGDTIYPDATCENPISASGYNCTGSDMGNLFYNVLGGVAGSSITTTHNTNYNFFSNIQSSVYWSATEYHIDAAYIFKFSNGDQDALFKPQSFFAWAVHSGDVSAVPEPTTVWLIGSGLLGLIGVARRKVRV